jgi:hypothetical protein
MNEEQTIAAPIAKVTSAWGVVGIAAWVDVAQLVATTLAALYTLALLCEWLWKKVIRPVCELQGWIKRKRRRHDDNKD